MDFLEGLGFLLKVLSCPLMLFSLSHNAGWTSFPVFPVVSNAVPLPPSLLFLLPTHPPPQKKESTAMAEVALHDGAGWRAENA